MASGRSSDLPAASRFAALKIDDVPSSDEEEPFQKVVSKKGSKAGASRGDSGSTPASSTALKNAKKRARKKRSAQASQLNVQGEDVSSLHTNGPPSTREGPSSTRDGPPSRSDAQLKTQQDDAQYQRDLEEAIRQSNVEAEKHRERLRMAGLDMPGSPEFDSSPGLDFFSLSSFSAPSESASATTDLPPSTQPVAPGVASEGTSFDSSTSLTGAPSSDLKTNEQRRKDGANSSALRIEEVDVCQKKKDKKEAGRAPSDVQLEAAVDAALQLAKEQQKTTVAVKKMADVEAQGVRVAELVDIMEKKDKAIADLAKMIKKLEANLSEVKKRNRQLCHILSKGEMSSKSELVEQVEELTAVKDELTDQVTELHSQLEQERSRNKKGGRGSKSAS